MKEESEKVGLKLNIQKTKVTTSGPITSREIDGETVETVIDFIFGDVPSKRLADWASLELSPSVESCGCGLGPSPVRLG